MILPKNGLGEVRYNIISINYMPSKKYIYDEWVSTFKRLKYNGTIPSY